jgi:hypothetical protein
VKRFNQARVYKGDRDPFGSFGSFARKSGGGVHEVGPNGHEKDSASRGEVN